MMIIWPFIVRYNLLYKNVEGVYINDYSNNNDGYIVRLDKKYDNDEELDVYPYEFFNLKTGRVDFTIDAYNLDRLYVDDEVYILGIDHDDMITVYNPLGKKVLGDNAVYQVVYDKGNIVTIKDNKFQVYDKNGKLKNESKAYTEIAAIGGDFAVVINDKKVELRDVNDQLLTTFITDYDESRYSVHSMLSGWYEENGKNGIYIIIQDDKLTYKDVITANPSLKNEISEEDQYDYGY